MRRLASMLLLAAAATSAQAGIASECRKKWGTDYRMVKYCVESQTAAKNAVNARAYGPIGTNCRQQWGSDYRMVKYCIDTQRKAKLSVATTPADETIRLHCLQKWGQDYRMVEYCIGQQSEAKKFLDLLPQEASPHESSPLSTGFPSAAYGPWVSPSSRFAPPPPVIEPPPLYSQQDVAAAASLCATYGEETVVAALEEFQGHELAALPGATPAGDTTPTLETMAYNMNRCGLTATALAHRLRQAQVRARNLNSLLRQSARKPAASRTSP